MLKTIDSSPCAIDALSLEIDTQSSAEDISSLEIESQSSAEDISSLEIESSHQETACFKEKTPCSIPEIELLELII